MILKKIRLKNIRSYEDQEISFPEGSVLLSGDIGSGKTSILMAIEYALFGLQPGQKGSALLRNSSDYGEVYLEFEVDNQLIILERKIRRGTKSITNEYAAITINGDKIESSITEIKTRVLEILGYPSEFIKKNNLLYKYTVYTPQEQMKQIIVEDSQTRLNVIRYIFGIDKYRIIRENTSLVLNRIKEQIKFIQGEIHTLDEDKNRLISTKKFVVMLEDKIREKELELSSKTHFKEKIALESKDLEEKIKIKENLEKEVEKTRILIGSKREYSLVIQKEILDLNKAIEDSKEPFDPVKYEEIIKKIKEIKDSSAKNNSFLIEVSGKINSLESMQKDLITKKERVFRMDLCPTCLQNVSESHKHNIENEAERDLLDISKKLNSFENEKFDLIASMEKEKTLLTKLEVEKNRLDVLNTKNQYLLKAIDKVNELKKTLSSSEKDIELLVQHLESLKSNILSYSKYLNLFKIKQEELRQALADEKTSEISLAELKKELEISNKEILIIQETVERKEKSKKKVEKLQELSEWLSTHFISLVDFTERNVLIKIRKEFSKLLSKWFNTLAGDSFEVILDETFTPLIIQGEVEMDYSFLSGGERTAVALAYRLALNQTINSVLSKIKTKDIVILDEPTEGFSEQQLDKIRDVLEEMSINQLIIVSHESKIESFVDNIIKVKKQGDVSLVESS